MDAATSGSTNIFNRRSISSPGKPISEMAVALKFAGRREAPRAMPAMTPRSVNRRRGSFVRQDRKFRGGDVASFVGDPNSLRPYGSSLSTSSPRFLFISFKLPREFTLLRLSFCAAALLKNMLKIELFSMIMMMTAFGAANVHADTNKYN